MNFQLWAGLVLELLLAFRLEYDLKVATFYSTVAVINVQIVYTGSKKVSG